MISWFFIKFTKDDCDGAKGLILIYAMALDVAIIGLIGLLIYNAYIK